MKPSVLRFALAAVVIAAPAALPAQRMSDSYEFLKAVRDADGTKVTEILDKPGSRIINARDDAGDGALHIVAKRSDATYIRFLLGRGADINLQDGRGNTPLMVAISSSCFGCVDTLIKQKANINLANASGETPLIRAVQLRNLDLARTLLDAGANPDQRDVIAGLSARDYAQRDTRSPALTKLLADAPKAGATRRVSGPGL
ncbi:ankyrin repeat domain-containing protein [Sphingomonas sp.]|uniref:ankyrin repeat domain-containing protein n=1 Tax=Sphingomonas sp. TaxID=28214 RepID=UPI002CD3C9ED|nr:ankyrin repeat domain-containing protein [Sphingomonas sp.]HWK35997.1 ankyrin repeat domain-containing protein [Sphingomonas sp.]